MKKYTIKNISKKEAQNGYKQQSGFSDVSMSGHGFITIKNIETYELPERSRLRYFDALDELELIGSFET